MALFIIIFMKLLIIILLLCFNFSWAKATKTDTIIYPKFKHGLNIFVTRANLCFNYGIAYMPYYKNHSLRIGLIFNVNNFSYFMNSASNTVYYQRGYQENFRQKIGLNIGYQYNIKIKKLPNLVPYVFFDTEMTKLKLRNADYLNIGADSSNRKFYAREDLISNKAGLTIANLIGLGFKLAVSKQINLDACVGVGVSMHFHELIFTSLQTGGRISTFPSEMFYRYGFSLEAAGMNHVPLFRLGLTYTFAKK